MRYYFLAGLCLWMLTSSGQITGTSYQQAKTSKTGELSFVYTGIHGFIENKNGQVMGLLVDIMEEFESHVFVTHGIKLTHKFIPVEEGEFSAMMNAVKQGKGGVFGLSNVSIREDRMEDFNFSPPYLNNVSLLVTNNKVPDLENINDISVSFFGKEALSVQSSTYHQRLTEIKNQHMPGLSIRNMPSGNEIIQELTTNKDAFAVLDLNFYLEALQKRYPLKRHDSCDIADDPFGIIMPKNNDWSPLLREFFDSGFIGGKMYGEIIAKNLGSSALRLIDSMKE